MESHFGAARVAQRGTSNRSRCRCSAQRLASQSVARATTTIRYGHGGYLPRARYHRQGCELQRPDTGASLIEYPGGALGKSMLTGETEAMQDGDARVRSLTVKRSGRPAPAEPAGGRAFGARERGLEPRGVDAFSHRQLGRTPQ